MDVRVKDIRLDQIVKGKDPDEQPPLDGVMQARALIDGRGIPCTASCRTLTEW
jgi:hypothetical protein